MYNIYFFEFCLQIDQKIKKSLRSSKSVDPILHQSQDGMMSPSPPKPPMKLPDHVTSPRRSSTGTIVKQGLSSAKGCDPRRVQSGPTKRTSPQREERGGRAKSSPLTRNFNSTSNNDVPANEERTVNQEDGNIDNPINDEAGQITKVYKDLIRPILKNMDECLNLEDSRGLCENCLKLSRTLYAGHILPETEAVRTSHAKSQILKSLFSYLHLKDPLLHLRLAKLVLMVCFNLFY